MTSINSGLRVVTKKLKDVASDIVTVRSGTVVSNYAALSQTMVTLDNDPDQTPVQAQALTQKMPSGARVQLLAFPPRGLVILGLLANNPIAPAIAQYTTSVSVPFPGGQYQFVAIEGVGGGAAGGSSAVSTAGNSSIGGGGGAAMYCRSIFRVDALSWPLSILPGAAGAAVAGAAGGNGGRSQVNNSLGTKIWAAEGGVGGGFLANGNGTNTAIGGRGAAEGLTQFLAQTAYFGGDGQSIIRTDTNLVTGGTAPAVGGHGGASFYGGGARGGANGAGQAGQVPGSGGGGSASFNTGAAQVGGAGGTGMILVNFS